MTTNWWFLTGLDKKVVGYWPNKLFTTLAQYATRLEFGGTVQRISNDAFPPMGSGHFPEEGYGKSCPFQLVKFIDINLQSNDLSSFDTTSDSDSSCYKVGDLNKSHDVGTFFYFGGPGGIDC